MPVTVQERFGRRLSDESAELLYLIKGTSDDAAARAALLSGTSSTHDGLVREDTEVEELEGLDAYLGIVRYASPSFQPPDTGESSFSFDTSGGTQHITQSLATVGTYADPDLAGAPDFGGAIGVTTDNVEGVDITTPVYTFSETHYLAPGIVTTGYKGTLFSLTGKVNSGGFKGLAAGECLFLGASGSKRGDGDWEITFRFAGSPNRSGLSVGDIEGIAKKGWEYLWVRYQDVEDDTAKMLIKKPIAAYVEQVYDEGNFAALGIGT